MSLISFLINVELKLKQYKVQFLFLFIFWFCGFLYFLITEHGVNIPQIVLYSFTIRTPPKSSDFINFYDLVWPILLEVIVFGFLVGELLEKYNPIVTSRILAKHKRNHAVIIGYQHLSDRIVDYCIENKKPFSIIEDDKELVEDLINFGKPVVVGDPTDINNLIDSGIKKAKEAFINVDDSRIVIICTEKIRKLNPDCKIYVRAFEEHVQDYLRQPPLNAFSFSTSKWAMEHIKLWLKGKSGAVVVIGRDRLTHRIAFEASLQENREIFLFDDINEGIEFPMNPNLHLVNDYIKYLSDLRKHVDLSTVSQIFICYNRESEFDEVLYLTSRLHLRYQHIKLYVRIFDEELLNLVQRYKAKTFSTSKNAFEMLQREVSPDSIIAK
ncbi:MAG: NAD-binding protein [Promethearchaeota archaeon]